MRAPFTAWGGWAALLFVMAVPTYSYGYGANPAIDYPRLLISDTAAPFVFADEEITAVTNIQALNFQSSMRWTAPAGQNLPSSPVSYLRIAAMLLDALAANKSRLSTIQQLLDVRLSGADSAIQLRTTAAEYRAVDDDAGAFAIIEQCSTEWAFRDRFWAQVQRQSGF
jgi:hypothetical protein